MKSIVSLFLRALQKEWNSSIRTMKRTILVQFYIRRKLLNRLDYIKEGLRKIENNFCWKRWVKIKKLLVFHRKFSSLLNRVSGKRKPTEIKVRQSFFMSKLYKKLSYGFCLSNSQIRVVEDSICKSTHHISKLLVTLFGGIGRFFCCFLNLHF